MSTTRTLRMARGIRGNNTHYQIRIGRGSISLYDSHVNIDHPTKLPTPAWRIWFGDKPLETEQVGLEAALDLLMSMQLVDVCRNPRFQALYNVLKESGGPAVLGHVGRSDLTAGEATGMHLMNQPEPNVVVGESTTLDKAIPPLPLSEAEQVQEAFDRR